MATAARAHFLVASRSTIFQMATDQLLAWLLEPDLANPGVRYFALRWLLDKPPDDREVVEAQAAVMRTGPVPVILARQHLEGWWLKPGAGYSTKYRGTVWQLIALHRLGADRGDPRVHQACEYVLRHTLNANGAFGWSGRTTEEPPGPSTGIHCLNGNLLAAMIDFGWLEDERVQRAIEWQALSITGEQSGFPYYKSGTAGPGFRCGSNAGLPCAWGANKALLALLAIPEAERADHVRRALEAGAEFLLSHDPAVADYPNKNAVSSTWFRFGLPLSYWSDVLETLEVLAALGYGADPRLDAAFELVLAKRDAAGCWPLENTINGRSSARIEAKDEPSKWVTLRALRVLRAAGRLAGAMGLA
jgi:hypothetical protein